MLEWKKISGLLCIFGFVRELRPSEPYITEFLAGPWRNVTEDELNRQVYPMGTYSYLAQLIVVFLITDFLLYKPLIITIGVTGIIVWSMLLWTTSLEALMTLEFFYGTYMAAEVAYYTYIYAKVDKKYYPRVTSHTRAAIFAGKLVASILAQLLLYFDLMDYRDLNYITLGAQIVATLWAFFLPKVDQSLYFHRKINNNDVPALKSADSLERSSYDDGKSQTSDTTDKFQFNSVTNIVTKTPIGVKLLWTHFTNAYTNLKVVQWSIWYAVGLCGYLQVTAYVQLMWKDIEPNPDVAWNGAVDAVFTALAALFALFAGYIHAGRLQSHSSLLVLAALSLLEGGTILMICWTTNIYVSYAGYILFGGIYGFIITVAGAEVARYLEEDSFGLVFGINTMLALIFQTVLTLVVISENGFALSTKGQFTVYAFYFIAVGIIYFIAVISEYLYKKFKRNVD
ncbi:thiamine transporter 1-like [Musca autumnalis]|uniref:thiamine transporter 1-like n=1 Tax=Musca autumnalis TaxID=221902 RepID=UPI003CFA0296